jgi:hypothetical protein
MHYVLLSEADGRFYIDATRVQVGTALAQSEIRTDPISTLA